MKTIATIFLILACISVNAQDVIIKNDKTEIKGKITEVSENEVKYKKKENINGPSYNIAKSKIFMILYENGTKDVFSILNESPKTENVTLKKTIEPSPTIIPTEKVAPVKVIVEPAKPNIIQEEVKLKPEESIKSEFIPYNKTYKGIGQFGLNMNGLGKIAPIPPLVYNYYWSFKNNPIMLGYSFGYSRANIAEYKTTTSSSGLLLGVSISDLLKVQNNKLKVIGGLKLDFITATVQDPEGNYASGLPMIFQTVINLNGTYFINDRMGIFSEILIGQKGGQSIPFNIGISSRMKRKK